MAAVNIPVLANAGYVLPGAYIGRLFRPKPTGSLGLVRLPCLVAQGNRLKTASDIPIRRSFITGETVVFGPATYTAALLFPSNGDKTAAKLMKSNGTVVDASKWNFATFSIPQGGYTQIIIVPEAFDPTATYLFDYQSVSRTVQDPIGNLGVEITDLREVQLVGDSQQQKKYIEGTDFFINTSVTNPVADSANEDPLSNPNVDPETTAVVPDGGNTGTGSVAFNASNAPTYRYNRAYLVEITAAAGVSPAATATARVTAVALGGGNASVPDQTVVNEGFFDLSLVEATPSTYTNVDAGHGIRLDFAFGATNFVVGDKFTFDLLGGARFELEAALFNTNQFASIGTPALGFYSQPNPVQPAPGTGTIAVGSDAAYSGTTNRRYELEVMAAAGVTPTRTATVRWRAIGELPATTGSLALAEATPASFTNVTLEQGIKLTFSFGASNFAVGEHFIFEALAPRVFSTAKDDRTVLITVTASSGGATPLVSYLWQANTFEGGFGTVVGVQQDVSSTTRNNLFIRARNLKRTSTLAYHAVGNKHSFTALDALTIDWSLQAKTVETIATSQIFLDATGAVTGTLGAYYLILKNVPQTILSVRNASTLAAVAYTAGPSGTPYVIFASNPGVQLEVTYIWRSAEPDPGNVYYMTALIKRPDEDYNTPKLLLSPDDATTQIGPMATDNHLLIGALVGFDQNPFGIYVVQAKDENEDGTYTDLDFQRAIDATETKSDITDLVVLSHIGVLGYAKASVEAMNDPFKRRPRMMWVGMPAGTIIGDVDTPGSLVQTARQTLQVFGQSPAHGKFVLAANTACTLTVLLPDKSTADVDLDGSFVAAGLACKTASFTDPGESMLNKDMAGYKRIGGTTVSKPYLEKEEIILGGASILTVRTIGVQPAVVHRIIETITVDTSDQSFNEISAVTQQEAVVRQVIADLESAVIGVTPSTAQDGVNIVAGAIVASLARQVGKGTIAPYQDDNGTARKIDASKDVLVFRDDSDKTKYNFLFAFWLKYTIKRVFGLYAVDTNQLGVG